MTGGPIRSAAKCESGGNVAPKRTRALLELVGACLLVLLVTLALNGLITLASLNRIVTDSQLTRAEVLGGEVGVTLERSIRFGRPLHQFLGLADVLDDLEAALPEGSAATVVSADGSPVPGLEQRLDAPAGLVAALGDAQPVSSRIERLQSGAATMHAPGALFLALPIEERDGRLGGALVISIDPQASHAEIEPMVVQSVVVLGATTSAAVLGLVWFLSSMVSTRRDDGAEATSPRALFALPIAAVIAAHAVYSWDTISTFRANYVELTRGNAEFLGQRLKDDLEALLARGLQLDAMRGVDEPVARIARVLPAIEWIDVLGRDGTLLHRIDGSGPIEEIAPAAAPADAIRLPLMGVESLEPAGHLELRIDPEVIAGGVRARILDASTVVLVSGLFALELFVLLYLWVGRAAAARPEVLLPAAGPPGESDATQHLLGRPVAFLFVLAWALPLSFLPLNARELPVSALAMPRDILIALPISVEMLCALVTALLAGVLTDRRGWHAPTLMGLFLAPAAALMSAWAPTLETFILARGVTGFAYGLTWMGIQGYVFQNCTALNRAQGIANLVAGIFTGQIAGMVIGAMIAERFGYSPVFVLSAALSVVPLVFVIGFLRPYMTAPERTDGYVAPITRETVSLLARSRDFVALIGCSVIPFSIAQVGLLYYALPLVLSAEGMGSAGIGRVMMVYGLCVILVGPLLGRLVDRSPRKRVVIALGGLIGGGGMASLYFGSDMAAMILAVLALGLAASVSGPAQSAYALGLPVVQRVGVGRAMGIQRAADKLGQMLGPLIVGALFPLVGMSEGLAITGLFYAVASVGLLVLATSMRGQRAAVRGTAPPVATVPAQPAALRSEPV